MEITFAHSMDEESQEWRDLRNSKPTYDATANGS